MANVRLLFAKSLLSSCPRTNLKQPFSTSVKLMKEEKTDESTKPLYLLTAMETKEVIMQQMREEKVEITEPMNIALVSGVPEEHIKERLVRIAKAPKSAMQSGTDNTHAWIMQFETRQRWENPLMGWCSSGDPLSNMQIRFNTPEEAATFCDKNGWEYYIEKEKFVAPKNKSYSHNFSWNKRTRVSTK